MNARRGIVSALMLAGTLTASTALCTNVQAALDEGDNKVVVKFGDLDISTEGDVKRLLRRLKRAARKVCGGYGGTPRVYLSSRGPSYLKCVTDSYDRAVETLSTKLSKRAAAAFKRGELKAAEAVYRRLFALNQVLERKERLIANLDRLASIAMKRSDLKTAESLYERTLTLNEELGRKQNMAANLDTLGMLARKRGDLKKAEYCHRQALALNAELDRREGIAGQLGKLGVIAWTEGDLDTAETFQRSALALHQQMGRQESMADNFANLGRIFRSRGQPKAAEAFHRRALALYTELGHKQSMSVELGHLWTLALEQNRLADAEAYLSNALRLNSELGMIDEVPAVGQTQMGLIHFVRGEKAKACHDWSRAKSIYLHIGSNAEAFRVARIMSDSGCDAIERNAVTAALSCDKADGSACPVKALPLPALKPHYELSTRSTTARPIIASSRAIR